MTIMVSKYLLFDLFDLVCHYMTFFFFVGMCVCVCVLFFQVLAVTMRRL